MCTKRSHLGRPSTVLTLFAATYVAGCGGDDNHAPLVPPKHEQRAQQERGAAGEERRGIFNTPYGPQELTYQLIDGQRVFQGDILLPPEEPDFRSAG